MTDMNVAQGVKGFTSRPASERFWEKVERTDDCWLWTGARTRDGYGRFWNDGLVVRAHHYAFRAAGGVIPDGMELDHLCRVRECVRSDHLEAVTRTRPTSLVVTSPVL